MSKATLSRRKEPRLRRNQARVAAVAAATVAAAVAITTPAAAATTSPTAAASTHAAPAPYPIDGGVEDGTFRTTCLSNTTTPQTAPSTAVLDAVAWRKGIKARVVRIMVPWNIAIQSNPADAKCLSKYLQAARHKATVEISLNRQSATRISAPSVRDYQHAINALAKLTKGGSLIGYLTAYNEPDNPNYLKAADPASASGRYYQIANANKAFHGKVVAGDFAEPVTEGFFHRYIEALGNAHPSIWAIHPYTDITNFQYFMHDPKTHRTARQAAQAELNYTNSYVVQFATLLKNNGYGSARIWLNEIYVTHRADRNPPSGVPGSKGRYNKKTHKWSGTTFSQVNQGYAGLFLDGGLGNDSLPGYLAAHGLPHLTRYVYMRADTNSLPEAYVLIVGQRGCLWTTLHSTSDKPAAQCSQAS